MGNYEHDEENQEGREGDKRQSRYLSVLHGALGPDFCVGNVRRPSADVFR